MLAPRIRGALSIAVVVAAAACGNSPTDGGGGGNNPDYTVGSLNCAGGNALALGVPTSATESGAVLCGGSSGAEYVAVAFHGTQDSTASVAATFHGVGTDVLSGNAPDLIPSAQPSFSLTPGAAPVGRGQLGDEF